ncbi:hypothetical protein CHUAL_001118 [Chamberlinius hualienensis]
MLNLISTLVGHLTAGVSTLVDGAAVVLYSALTLNFVLIRAMCNIFVYCFTSSLNLLTDILLACHYGILDFASFIYDVIDIWTVILSAVFNGFTQLLLNIFNLFQSLTFTFYLLCQTFRSTYNLLAVGVKAILIKLIESINLVGRSIKIILILVPKTFISCVQLLIQIFLLTIDAFFQSLLWTGETTVRVIKRSLINITNQSSEFYIAILTAILLFYAFKHRTQLGRYLRRFEPLFDIFCRQIRKMTANISSILSVIPVRRENPEETLTGENYLRPEVLAEEGESENEEEVMETPLPGTPTLLRNHPRNPTPTETNSLTRRNLRKDRDVAEMAEELERLRDIQMCIICQDAIRCVILLPCRHLCLCQICVRKLLERQVRCPICRSIVNDSWQVYA